MKKLALFLTDVKKNNLFNKYIIFTVYPQLRRYSYYTVLPQFCTNYLYIYLHFEEYHFIYYSFIIYLRLLNRLLYLNNLVN
jgi:hypothetical protein